MQSGSCAFNWADNSQYPGQTADSPWIPSARVQAKPTDQSGIQKVNLSAEHQCGFWLS